MIKTGYFVVTKKSGYHKDGRLLSATQCARTLLGRNQWVISKRAAGAKNLSAGDHIAVYLSGRDKDCGVVMATARIATVRPWVRKDTFSYPLMLEAEPGLVLELDDVQYLDAPTAVKERLSHITFVPQNHTKWGSAFMKSLRAISRGDFEVLTRARF